QHYHQPFGSYSSGMRSRLAMGTSMGIHFDTYLVDEVTSVGDANFRAKSQRVFAERMARSSAIVVSHSMPMIRNMCTMGAVLHNASLTIFDNIDQAIKKHEEILRLPQTK
ncbi:ABC transporter ATP-binding protein, partial [Paracoccus sp. APAP_BH8]